MSNAFEIDSKFRSFYKPSTTPISHIIVKTEKNKFFEFNTSHNKIEEQMVDDISYYDRDEVNKLSLISTDLGFNLSRIVGDNVNHDVIPNFNKCTKCIFHNGKVSKFETDDMKKNFYCEFNYKTGRTVRRRVKIFNTEDETNINQILSNGDNIIGNVTEKKKDIIFSYDGRMAEIRRLTEAKFYGYLTFAASSLVFREDETISRMINGMQIKRNVNTRYLQGISCYSPISSTLLLDTRGFNHDRLRLFDIKRYNNLAELQSRKVSGGNSAIADMGAMPTIIIGEEDKVLVIQ